MSGLKPVPVFEAFPKQVEFVQAVLSRQYNYLLYGGAIRGGKTWLGLAILLMFCRLWPRSRWAIVRKDLPTLRRNIIPTFEKMRPTSFMKPLYQAEWTYTAVNGSQLILFPESIKDDPELERWKGLEVNGFLLEELPELKERSFWKSVERAGSWIIPDLAVQPPPYVLATCNPSPGFVKRLFRDPHHARVLRPPWYFLQAKASDNPHIPEEVKESWKHMPKAAYERFVNGSWDNMSGMALAELSDKHHMVTPFRVPEYWRWYASFDWGFSHPWVFMVYATNEDGEVYLVETIRGRRDRDVEILDKIGSHLERMKLPKKRLEVIYAGHDCWHDVKARGQGEVQKESQPTTAERFADVGLALSKANLSRVTGLRNMREWLAWTPIEEHGPERVPRFRMFRTLNNLRTFDSLSEMMLDPDDPEDALKTDADPESGEGGDDPYDCLRYGLASRPTAAVTQFAEDIPSAWDPAVLAYEADRLARGLPPVPGQEKPKPGKDLAAGAGF